jgi:hypothetical protein
MKTYKHWSAMRQTRGVPPQSGDVFSGMPQSGDVLVEMKVSQNTFWRKMNRHCTLGGKKPVPQSGDFSKPAKNFFEILLLAKNEYLSRFSHTAHPLGL